MEILSSSGGRRHDSQASRQNAHPYRIDRRTKRCNITFDSFFFPLRNPIKRTREEKKNAERRTSFVFFFFFNNGRLHLIKYAHAHKNVCVKVITTGNYKNHLFPIERKRVSFLNSCSTFPSSWNHMAKVL